MVLTMARAAGHRRKRASAPFGILHNLTCDWSLGGLLGKDKSLEQENGQENNIHLHLGSALLYVWYTQMRDAQKCAAQK